MIETDDDDDGGGDDGAVDIDSVPMEIMSEVGAMMPSELTLEDAAVIAVIKELLQMRKAGQMPTPEIMAKMRAQLCAAALNAKAKANAPVQAGKMIEAELEINDYPQQARWKVTHKDALTPITEWTGCAITTRGTYVAPGRNPMPGERKLYLFIEGADELSVHRAKTEIKRILVETSASAFPEKDNYGKYK